jgi:hypothetical protein
VRHFACWLTDLAFQADKGVVLATSLIQQVRKDVLHQVEVAVEKNPFFERIRAKWGLAGALAKYPMALDEAGARLFVGCRLPARPIVLDTVSGESSLHYPP